ncbi:MAG: serine hydrolase domain-containing protein [Microthrixaceae bacterium]
MSDAAAFDLQGWPEPTPSTSVALPAQPDGVAWPTAAWETGEQLTGDPERLAQLLDEPFRTGTTDELGDSLAFIAVQGGRIIAERYSPSVTHTTTLLSWSMAKSVTHAAVGLLVGDGLVDTAAAVDAPEWSGTDDPRAAITLDDLLAMRSGLHFTEDYVDVGVSNCLEMLFGEGAHDVAGYAASQPLEHPIGQVFNYSSGTTNIVTRHLATLLVARDGGDPDDPETRRSAMERLLQDRLFSPIGVGSAELRYDEAGTFVGSSYLYATARDFARFGLLYLRDGVWDGERILPEGWVGRARTIRSVDPQDGWFYGHHWWVRGDRYGTFWANGYEKQLIVCVPALDLVVVRLGKTLTHQRDAFQRFWHDVVDAVAG